MTQATFHHPRPASLILAFTVLALAALSAGCSGHDHYVRGQQYVEQNETEESIVEFRQAVEADPTNAEYQQALALAEASAADQHVKLARELLARGDRDAARAHVTEALSHVPEHPEATSMLAELNGAPATQPAQAAAPRKTGPASAPAVDRSIAYPNSRAGQGPGTTPTVSRDMPRMPSARPAGASAGAPANPAAAPPADAPALPAPATPELAAAAAAGEFPAGSFPATLSRDDDAFPKEVETLDEIYVRLKNTKRKPLKADIEVRVGKMVKRYHELRVGGHVTGRGYSRKPYQITILAIEPESETVSFVVEPLNRLPIR